MTSGLRPGQVAQAMGVHVETLRYYERRGIEVDQHVTDPIRREVASRIGGLLFAAPAGAQNDLDDP